MLSASVSNIECFRAWKQDEDLDFNWLMRKIRGEEPQSELMKAGNAFHSAIELMCEGECNTLAFGEYRFDFNCHGEISSPSIREASVEKQYGDLLVRGRVDAWIGKEITDYKTTGQFDPDRLMEGYQWRFYLDMTESDSFCWKVFVMRDFGPERCYEIRDVHTLRQKRYPGLHEDCVRLAAEYQDVVSETVIAVGA